jgi:hypothetical protein
VSWVRAHLAGILAFCAVAAALLAAVADYRHSVSQFPPVTPLCQPDTDACNEARNQALDDRLDRILALQADYQRRIPWYAGFALAGVGAWTVVSLRRARSNADLRRVFRRLGVSGVLLGIVVSALLFAERTGSLEQPLLSVYFPSLAMLVAAGLGGVAARLRDDPSPPEEERPAPAWRTYARYLGLGGLGATAVTILLAWIYAQPQPACGGSETTQAPGWTDALPPIALATTLGAFALAIVGLFAGRWFVALACFVVNPAAILFMAASSCAFY